jgi:hypothetical protein
VRAKVMPNSHLLDEIITEHRLLIEEPPPPKLKNSDGGKFWKEICDNKEI